MAKTQVSEGLSKVRGNTLRVYLYLLQHGPCELKDVQKELEFSTASLASYHLGRLIEAGYASQNAYGQYEAAKDSTREILEGYTRVGPVVIPQLFFFAVLFTVLIGYFTFMSSFSASYLLPLEASSIALVGVIWYEAVKLWRKLTTWK